jgi:hypothetical protein
MVSEVKMFENMIKRNEQAMAGISLKIKDLHEQLVKLSDKNAKLKELLPAQIIKPEEFIQTC